MNINKFHKTDAEYMERFEHFAFEEVSEETQFDKETKYLVILASLLGCQGKDAFKWMCQKALNEQMDPVLIKEVVYQATDYLGFGKIVPFLQILNKEIEKQDLTLPLPSQQTTTYDDRLEKGIDAQAEIFGEGMREAWKAGPINKWLADNCFGDYYTRKGLNLAQREMITFCFLMAQGGCEPQLTAHAKGNMNMGNDASFLQKVVYQCLPFIGYPRSLNALNCIKTASED